MFFHFQSIQIIYLFVFVILQPKHIIAQYLHLQKTICIKLVKGLVLRVRLLSVEMTKYKFEGDVQDDVNQRLAKVYWVLMVSGVYVTCNQLYSQEVKLRLNH